jgi:hypothetical protein
MREYKSMGYPNSGTFEGTRHPGRSKPKVFQASCSSTWPQMMFVALPSCKQSHFLAVLTLSSLSTRQALNKIYRVEGEESRGRGIISCGGVRARKGGEVQLKRLGER